MKQTEDYYCLKQTHSSQKRKVHKHLFCMLFKRRELVPTMTVYYLPGDNKVRVRNGNWLTCNIFNTYYI